MGARNKEIVKDSTISLPWSCYGPVPAEQDQLLSARIDRHRLKQGNKKLGPKRNLIAYGSLPRKTKHGRQTSTSEPERKQHVTQHTASLMLHFYTWY